MIEVVSATRLSEADFWKGSALGNSLRRLAHDKRLVPRVSFGNRQGLPVIYNARLAAGDGCELMVFVHDDVWLDDGFWPPRDRRTAEYDVSASPATVAVSRQTGMGLHR